MSATESDQRILSDAKRAAELESAHQLIETREIQEAERLYRLHLDSIAAAAKRREVEMQREGITLSDVERQRIRRRWALAGAVVGLAGVAGGLAAGAYYSGGADSPADPQGGAEETVVSQLIADNGVVVRVTSAFESEKCGTAVALGVVGPSGAGNEFDLSSLDFSINGQRMTIAGSTEKCLTDNTVYADSVGTFLLYLDGQYEGEIREATVSLAGKTSVWSASEEPAVTP